MRRKTFTFGIILVLLSIFILEQGPQVLNPFAQAAGLSSPTEVETPILPQTLISVPPGNYSYLPVSLSANIPVKGTFEVTGNHELAFYVMNQGNFSQWRAGHPSAVLLVKSTAAFYNFTLTPVVSDTYDFIFENSDSSARDVVFSLSAVQNTVTISPIIQFAGIETLAIGIIFAYFGVRGGKKKIKQPSEPQPIPAEVAGWSCKYCGTRNGEGEIFCESCGRSNQ
jgi:hypothetical protein